MFGEKMSGLLLENSTKASGRKTPQGQQLNSFRLGLSILHHRLSHITTFSKSAVRLKLPKLRAEALCSLYSYLPVIRSNQALFFRQNIV